MSTTVLAFFDSFSPGSRVGLFLRLLFGSDLAAGFGFALGKGRLEFAGQPHGERIFGAARARRSLMICSPPNMRHHGIDELRIFDDLISTVSFSPRAGVPVKAPAKAMKDCPRRR